MVDPYKFQPLDNRVLVRDSPVRSHPQGLVVVRENPDQVDVVSNQTDGDHGDYRRIAIDGEVIACGPGKLDKKLRRIPLSVKPGERVRYTSWQDGEGLFPPGFRLIREADIWGYADGAA
jgi:co-chaperonin GroES (HSP10)